MSAFAGLCGALVGLGVLLVVAGCRGVALARPRRVVRLSVERVSLRAGLAVAAAVVVGVATGWPVGALLAGLAGWGAPGLVAGAKGERARIARVEAVAGWAEMLRDTMAGAAGLEQAVVVSAPLAPLALREEVVALAAALERGERLALSLRALAERVGDPTCDLVVAALVLAAEHQVQHLGALLTSLAQAARDQVTMRLRVEAGRARARTSVKVVVGATAALALGLVVLDRGFLAPYSTALGQLVLLVIGGLFATSFVWLSKMTRPVEPARLLAGADALVAPGPAGEARS